MGYLSCNAESAIATCDSYNFELLTKKPGKNRPFKIGEFTFSDLSAATDGFSTANLLGKGSHGSVYKAYLHQIKRVAAVKRTKQTHSAGGCAADNEVEILSRIYHPRLVNLLGFAADANQRKLIVVEFMPNGSLYELLHGPGKGPGWVKRTRFALQVAWAVQLLHSSHPPIIHRDIKSSNVLIDADLNSRLGDFGLALRGHVEDVKVRCTPPAGTLGYLDPGYLAPGDLSTKSDVFSFGILLLEIISGRNAIDVNYSPPSVVEWALPELKSGNFEGICDPRIGPPEDSEALHGMAVLAARCVRSTAEKRPGMAEVVECLKSVYKRMKMQSQVCISLGRRVERVVQSSHVTKYEPLDDSVECISPIVVSTKSARMGSKRKGKVSSAMSLEIRTVARSSDVIKYELLDDNVEHISSIVTSTRPIRMGSRRNGKASSATSLETRRGVAVDRVARSKSIGTASEVRFQPTDHSNDHINRRRVGLSMKMSTVRLSKSKSMGILQSKRLVNGARKLEESKLLVDLVESVKGEEKEY